MDNALKGLLLGAGVVLTCMIIGLGFYMAREAKSTAGVSADSLIELRNELSQEKWDRYDGVTVNGNDVVNFTKKLLRTYGENETSPITVEIHTSSSTVRHTNNINLTKLRQSSGVYYVNPLYNYIGTVIRDENDVVIRIKFVEQNG